MLEYIIEPLLLWYKENKRILPWRDQNNPYYTWVSEIMLQQTRVEAVKPYFVRFISELPNEEALADCSEEKLMKLWEGLGYYSRVRNMQEAARTVVDQYNEKLPASYEELLKLKGIGSYTAGAIASIAFGIPVPAVDGNVLRVISRVLGSRDDISKSFTKKKMENMLKDIMPKDSPGDFNQALMELGATVCVPNGQAKCDACPISKLCVAHKEQLTEEIPVKSMKLKRTIEKRTVFVIQDGIHTMIRKRKETGLLAGLYELPNEEGHYTKEEAIQYVESMSFQAMQIEELPKAKHIFSHIEWHMKGYRIRVSSLDSIQNSNIIFTEKKQYEKQYAIPSAFGAYTKYMKEEII